MNPARELFYCTFYVLYRFDLAGSGKEWNKWKALVFLTILEGCLLVSLDLWIGAMAGAGPLLARSKAFVLVAVVMLILANHRALITSNQWEHYLEWLRQQPKSGRRWRIVAGLAAILVVCGICAASVALT
jgi:hypothetical protein